MTDLAFPADVELTTTSLTLHEKTAFAEWDGVGARLFTMEQAVMWWIGDWWRYGNAHYGERAAAALDSSRYAFQTFADAGWVSGAIETSRRREVPGPFHKRGHRR